MKCYHVMFLPLKSAGTRNFFLSMSGIEDLGTFSTITYYNNKLRININNIYYTIMK